MANILDWYNSLLGPTGQDPTQSWTDMQQGTAGTAAPPGVLNYMQDVLSGRVAANGVLNQQRPAYDLDKPLRENLPGISDQAIDIAMGIGPGAIRAFHGSPYNFSRFDSSKIGTGEGAQAYGHGLYFAEAEPVARQYRDKLADRPGVTVGGEPQPLTSSAFDPGNTADQIVASRISSKWRNLSSLGQQPTIDDVVRDVHNNIQGSLSAAARSNDFSVYSSLSDQATALSRMRDRGIDVQPHGKMYEVNINAEPEQFLNWDKPLIDQPQTVQDAMARRVAEIRQSGQPTLSSVMTDIRRGTLPGGSVYATLGRGTPESATQVLAEAGIPGIRYLDQGSRGAGAGTSNYVVFDDKLIDILRKYGIAGLIGGGGAAATTGGLGDLGGM